MKNPFSLNPVALRELRQLVRSRVITWSFALYPAIMTVMGKLCSVEQVINVKRLCLRVIQALRPMEEELKSFDIVRRAVPVYGYRVRSGIDTYDLVLILRHIACIKTCQSFRLKPGNKLLSS